MWEGGRVHLFSVFWPFLQENDGRREVFPCWRTEQFPDGGFILLKDIIKTKYALHLYAYERIMQVVTLITIRKGE